MPFVVASIWCGIEAKPPGELNGVRRRSVGGEFDGCMTNLPAGARRISDGVPHCYDPPSPQGRNPVRDLQFCLSHRRR